MAQIVIFSDVGALGLGRYAGAYRIATELRDSGYEVQVIDFYTNFTAGQMNRAIQKFVNENTLWVGFSTTLTSTASDLSDQSDQKKVQGPSHRLAKNTGKVAGLGLALGRRDARQILQTIKSVSPRTKIVLGGKSSSQVGELFKNLVDYVVEGQGEHSILHITKKIISDRKLISTDHTPEMTIYTDKEFPVTDYNAPGKYRIRFHETDLIFPGEALPMEIARGCIFKCSFCAFDLNGKKLSEFNRDPQTIMEDLKDAHDRFGTTRWAFADDTYNDSVEKVKILHKHITALPFKIEWSSYIRHDVLIRNMDETATLLYESGLRGACFGIETFNHKAGKAIGKGMPPEETKAGLARLRKVHGWDEIICVSGFIIGLPFETEEDLDNSLEYLIDPDCPLDNFSIAALYIHEDTGFSKNLEKYGYKIKTAANKWVSEWMSSDDAKVILRRWQIKQAARFAPNGNGRCSTHTAVPTNFFIRATNLGYTLEEVKNSTIEFDEFNERKMDKIQEYFNKLMDL